MTKNDAGLESAKDKLRSLLAEGLNSPQGRPWAEIKEDLIDRAIPPTYPQKQPVIHRPAHI